MRSFYPDADTYTRQLRQLEDHVEREPPDAAARFVLAYHYLVLDEREEAAKQLREVARLEPDDRLAAGLADALSRAGEGTGRPWRKR
jgi:cytochrome c-type biogenesis protein CcmH/NrfG